MARDLLRGHYLRQLHDGLRSAGVVDAAGGDLGGVTGAVERSILSQLEASGHTAFAERFPHEAVRLAIACMTLRLGGKPPVSMHRNLALSDAATLPPYPNAA